MRPRRILAILIMITGIGLLVYGDRGTKEMEAARDEIESAGGWIPPNPITGPYIERVKRFYHDKVDEYRGPVLMLYIGGGVLVVGGIILMSLPSKKKRSPPPKRKKAVPPRKRKKTTKRKKKS